MLICQPVDNHKSEIVSVSRVLHAGISQTNDDFGLCRLSVFMLTFFKEEQCIILSFS